MCSFPLPTRISSLFVDAFARFARVNTLASLALAAALCGFTATAVEPTPAAAPDEDCAQRVVARVQARYDQVQDLQARFEQSTESVTLANSALASEEVSRGRVVIAKPGKMRWTYQEPAPSLVVSDGANLWLYDPAAAEVQHLHVESGYLAGAALQFLMGEGVLAETYDVSAQGCAEERVSLELTPKQPATYERLGLRVQAKTGVVLETTIVDLFGNVTRISFTQQQTNRGPDPQLFTFQRPEGVRLIELEATR